MENLAFKDFKGAVTHEEFAAVLKIVAEEYKGLQKLVKSREKFRKATKESMRQIEEQSIGMPPKLAEKLIEGLKRRAEEEVESKFTEQIKRHRAAVDFLNRFNTTDNQLPYLDLKIKE